MKSAILATLCTVLLAAAPGHAAGSDTMSCKAEEKLHPAGSRASNLTLDLRDGAVVGVHYTANIGGNGGGDSRTNTCKIELTEGDGVSNWKRSGDTVKVSDRKSIEDEHEGSYTEIETLADGYRLRLTHVARNNCGNAVDFPETVTLKKGSRDCAVTYRTPPPR